MDDVLKLIYANFLLTTQAKLGRGYPDWTGFVYDLVKDNYDIKDKLFNFIDQYAANPNDPRIWRIKLLVHQWAPSEDL